jgi:O-antigen/teichoic acid export membrane protein
MLLGLITIPLLLSKLGAERFGLLSIAWLIVGYSSIFELGIGRSVTQQVALVRFKSDDQAQRLIFWSAITLTLIASTIAMLATIQCSGYIINLLNVPAALKKESVSAVQTLAFSVPFQLVTIQLVSYLAAYEHFREINYIKIPSGCLLVIAPVLSVGSTQPLVVTCQYFLGIRMATMLLYWIIAASKQPEIRKIIGPEKATVLRLVKFGGWLSVSTIISPLLLHTDRLVIGVSISAAAVAAYVTCIDTITKLHIIPTSITTALYPRLAAAPSRASGTQRVLYEDTLKWTERVCFPVLATLSFFGNEALSLWISREFAVANLTIFQIAAVGMYLNCIAQVPTTTLHAAGRPDLTAKIHLVEAIVYIPAIALAAAHWGLVGVAATWTARLAVDAVVLLLACEKYSCCNSENAIRIPMRHLLLTVILLTATTVKNSGQPLVAAFALAISFGVTLLPTSFGKENFATAK